MPGISGQPSLFILFFVKDSSAFGIKQKSWGFLTFCHDVCIKSKHPAKRDFVFRFVPGLLSKGFPFEVTRGFRNVTPTASAMASFLLTVLMKSRQLMAPPNFFT